MTFELEPPEKAADMLLHHLGAAAAILVARAVDQRHLDQMLEAASGHLYEMAAEQDGPLVGVERAALQPLRAREEIAREVAKIVDEPLGDGALAACDYMGDEAADDLRKAITRALSRTAGQEWREAEGWQLVPKMMTPRMEDAFHDAFPRRENADHPNDRDKPRYNALGDHTQLLDELWTALLSAAPPVAEPIVAEQRPEPK